MDEQALETLIREVRILHRRRYAEAAYFFVLEALDYSMFIAGKSRLQGEERHLSCEELLYGLRRYASEEFGPLAPVTFRSWGIQKTDDFGAIVFQMCEIGLLSRREQDREELFHEAFDIEQAFAK